MAKIEVQIRSCFCCGLSLATILIALYTLLLYSLLTGLASWGLSDSTANADSSHYTNCYLEALGKVRPDNRKLTFHQGTTTIVIEDSSSYHCSFGLYTEELIFSYTWRRSTLVIDIILYVLIIIASILLLIGLASYVEWLLVPWIFLMILDIIRGLIIVFFIFFYAYWNLVRIATAIFFLGLQFFHISLVMIMIAKFQRMHNRNIGNIIDGDKQYDARTVYPTLPSNYAYSPQMRRDQIYYTDQRDPRAYDTMYRQQQAR
ncbi:NADH-quinone oxidoreductase subunit K [Dirofilaria immitis]